MTMRAAIIRIAAIALMLLAFGIGRTGASAQDVPSPVRIEVEGVGANDVATLETRIRPTIDASLAELSALFGQSVAPQLLLKFGTVPDPAQRVSLVSAHDLAWISLSDRVATFDLDAWSRLAPAEQDNLIRYVLNRQATSDMSRGAIPAGLANGFATYAERPILAEQARRGSVVQQLDFASAVPDIGTIVSGSPSTLTLDQRTAVEYAFVAFIIDHYGLSVVRDVILAAPSAIAWQTSLPSVTGESVADIDAAWQRYLPRWFNGDWQLNVLQGFDLSQASALFDRGAYAASIAVAERSETLFTEIDDPVGLAATETLIARASVGVRAEQLMQETQGALNQHRYTEAAASLDLATIQFSYLPESHSPTDLIATWRDLIDRGIAATADLASANAAADVWTRSRQTQDLAGRAASELALLGDSQRAAEASQLASDLEQRLHRMTFIAIAMIVLVALWLLIWLWAWSPSRFIWSNPVSPNQRRWA